MSKTVLPHLALPALLACAAATQSAWAQKAPVEMAGTLVAVSNGELSRLGGNKRLALAACMVEFKTSVQVMDKGSMFNRNTTHSTNSFAAVPKDVLQDVTNKSCAALRDKLTKAGFTLVPDEEIKASPAFAPLLALAGLPAGSVLGSNSAAGTPIVFADATIPQYLPYVGEGAGIVSGPATVSGANYEKALADAKPAPGGFEQSRRYDLPGLEIQLAKALNAHVVKAWSVVGFGGASASSERDWTAYRTSIDPGGGKTAHTATVFKAEGDSLLSVVEHHTRLAVRLADGKPMGYTGMIERGPKFAPTDGDVVVKLAAPIVGGNSFFAVSKGEAPAETGALGMVKGLGLGSLIAGAPSNGGATGLGRGSASFNFDTKISQPDAYRDTAVLAIGAAHDGIVGLLAKP